jgi:deoxyribodipyrimidine photo-lyase
MERMDDRPIIVWFRRDLRTEDNPALSYAAGRQAPVLPVYCADWERDDRWAPGEAGRWWLARSLECLATSLSARGAPLVTMAGRPEEALPALARSVGAREVACNRLYEPYARSLDRRISAALDRDGIGFATFNAGLLFEPEDLVSRTGKPFVQFTAYWRSCRSLLEPEPPQTAPQRLRSPERGNLPDGGRGAAGSTPPAEGASSWQPGEAGAQVRLQRFVEQALAGYEQARDYPGVEGTSRLSPHMHFGEIGPRQVWHAVRDVAWRGRGAPGLASTAGQGADGGADAFLRQLGWREFAHYLLFHLPWIAEEPFRPDFAGFPWQDDPVGLDTWQRGATGYPLVDAGMRQLLAEGWMHNRVRMVVASFLTKDLLISWGDGAAWFWDRLVDADLANNTLGWQWTAGCGPDAAPYFRVFNPVLQARRFDAEGTYVRRWKAATEAPGEEHAGPPPIVDHAVARARALAAFGGLGSRRGPTSKPGKTHLPTDMQV